MTMFYASYGGERQEVPAEDEQVLARYRDSMPLVWEIQEFGPPQLYALIEEEDPKGTSAASTLEQLAGRAERALKAARRGGNVAPAPLEKLVTAAVRAHLVDEYTFTGSMHDWFEDQCGKDCRAVAAKDVQRTAAKLQKAIERIAADVVAELEKIPAGAPDSAPLRAVA